MRRERIPIIRYTLFDTQKAREAKDDLTQEGTARR